METSENFVKEQPWPHPTATVLRMVTRLCSRLVLAAPQAPRTSLVMRSLLECGSHWASVGWGDSIAFNIFLTYTRWKILKELGETSNAISWYKDALQIIEEQETKISHLNGNVRTKPGSFYYNRRYCLTVILLLGRRRSENL